MTAAGDAFDDNAPLFGEEKERVAMVVSRAGVVNRRPEAGTEVPGDLTRAGVENCEDI